MYKHYAQYKYSKRPDDWVLGSDGIRLQDGRWTIPKCIQDAKTHGAMLNKNLHKSYTHFDIYKGGKKVSGPHEIK